MVSTAVLGALPAPVRRRRGRAGDEGVEIVVSDALRRSRAAHGTQVDARFAGLQAHRWRRKRPLARRTRQRGSRRGRRRGLLLGRDLRRGRFGGRGLRSRRDRLRLDARLRRGLLLGHARFRRGGSLGIRRSRRIDANEFGPDGQHVADRPAERKHAARHRRWNVDGRLVGHHRGDDLILLDEIADLDRPLDDLGFRDPLADVGHLDRAHAHFMPPSS